ncbi:MAG: retropepsin-like domain-containing protein [Deltaproteobacteria bacterium]|nr:retropepsin-like domain-containing protein [Deltaproteobacteria bacterium]
MNKIESYRYDPRKDIIHIPGYIWGPLGEQRVKLAFDPGAYRTIVNTSLTDSLGYQANPKSRGVSTSSIVGREWGYTLVVQKLSILSFEFANVEIACFDLPEKYDIDGLIGLDLIEKFEITLRHKDRWIQFRLLD